MKREEFLRKCDEVQKYWRDRMPMMVMEEAAELIQAISKYERYIVSSDFGIIDDDKAREISQNLIDEVGDMYISLMALQFQYKYLNEHVDPYKPVEELIELRIEKKLNKKY